mgnify:CR=1 FL=1
MTICGMAIKFNPVNKMGIEKFVINIYHCWYVKVRSYTTQYSLI